MASLWMAADVWATGPGGWDHLGIGAVSSSAPLNGRVDALISVPHRGAIPDARGKRCTRAVKDGRLTRANLPNGRNTIAFSGRIGKRALRPGAYTATLRARNAKGRSKPVAVRFSVVK